MPSSYENRVSGTVTAEDGKPIEGAIVKLYQVADNGSAYIPMRGAGSGPVTTATDANGSYEFYGVSPSTDDGKPIQAVKDIKAAVEYGAGQTAWSEPEPLYYPDVLIGYGQESQAREVMLPVVLSPVTTVQPTATVSDAPSASLAILPLLAALAMGLLCIVGLYMVFGRKG
jgi:hypothetical protein